MPNPRLTGFAGSWSQPSKTRALVTHATEAAVDRFGAVTHVFDLSDLGDGFGTARRLEDLPPGARRHVDALLTADALIVASPIYKGSYTGLFKHLFDLLDPTALRNKPVLLAATGGGEKHALVIEHQLRPLFGFFETATLPTGVYASDRDFQDGRPYSAALSQRLDSAIGQFAPFLTTAPRPPRGTSDHRQIGRAHV